MQFSTHGPEAIKRVSRSHDHAIIIGPLQVEGQVRERSEQIVEPILRIQATDIAEDRFAHSAKPFGRFDHFHLIRPWSVSDDKASVSLQPASIDMNLLVGFVGGDGDVGKLQAELFCRSQSP